MDFCHSIAIKYVHIRAKIDKYINTNVYVI